jgi:hypothetical protein
MKLVCQKARFLVSNQKKEKQNWLENSISIHVLYSLTSCFTRKEFFLRFCHLFICLCVGCVLGTMGERISWLSGLAKNNRPRLASPIESKQSWHWLPQPHTHTTLYCQLIRSVCQSFTCSKRPPPFTCKPSTIQVNNSLLYFMLAKDSPLIFRPLPLGPATILPQLYLILKSWGVEFFCLRKHILHWKPTIFPSFFSPKKLQSKNQHKANSLLLPRFQTL